MKKNDNKKAKLMLKKIFTKDQLLILKKYDRLLAYNIPYDVINRAYKRYIKNVDEYILMRGYPSYWFGKDECIFCNAVKIYINSKEYNHTFEFGTFGYTNIEIVKISGIDKYLKRQ